MFSDPLDKWLWATPPSTPTGTAPFQTEALKDVQKLTVLGSMADPGLVPFWLDTAVNMNSHNPFHYERLIIATAALALIAIHREADTAVDALRQLTNQPHPAVREFSIHYLGRAYSESEKPIPEAVLNEIMLIATNDQVFEPRFQARRILQFSQQPLPQDNPGGVYDLKVMPRRNRRAHRTIAVRSEQTLRDLQRFIQHAFEWDNEHLFSFYMNGRKYDDRYRFSCAHEEDRPPWAYEAVIGQLGLVPGHRFLYQYDYGEDHLFEIEVIAVRRDVPADNYPRLVDSHGRAPSQRL
jgi:hypothetical protein